jgi:hypothetical protein
MTSLIPGISHASFLVKMADASRPRPRPKPKQKAAASIPGPAAPGPSSLSDPSLSTSKKKATDVQDSDEMFMRNRKRTNKDWEYLEKLNKGMHLSRTLLMDLVYLSLIFSD